MIYKVLSLYYHSASFSSTSWCFSSGISLKIVAQFSLRLALQRRPTPLRGNSLDFEFIRQYMEMNQIRPKFLFLTKTGTKMTYLVYLFCFLLCFRL